MNIQNLVRERIIGNIKIGRKENERPQKLPYFHVEEDKGTSSEMVEIFKQLYPEKTTKLKIRFTNENPFNYKFKRYAHNKAVCIGNGTKAITIGKDEKNNNTQIEIECNEKCQHIQSGKCKLRGTLKFELEGIDAGGVWKLNTSGENSLSNIASEILKYRKKNISIVGVPFELILQEKESLAYGTYYSIDLHRTDIKPQLVADIVPQFEQSNTHESNLLAESTKKDNDKKGKKEIQTTKVEKENTKTEIAKAEDHSKDLYVKGFIPTLIKGKKFTKIIFQDINSQDVEYVLHPKANQAIINCGVGTIIEIKEARMEMDKNILCKYDIRQMVNIDGTLTELENKEELKEAV